MKDPAFLFYTNDFYSGISDLTMEERGQYITLLCLQHLKGHLSEKTIQLAVGKATEDVLKKFTLDEQGLFYNKRLEHEINKRSEYAEKQRDRINKRWNKNNTTEDTVVNTTVLPKIVNINEDINTDIIKNESINKKEVEKQKTISEVVAYLNQKTGSSFKPTTKETNKLISARIKNYTFEDFKKVIDHMTEKWINDPKMSDYLVPKTLFSEANFEKYLNMANKSKQPTTADSKIGTMRSLDYLANGN